MANRLSNVNEYIRDVRVLLLDKIEPFRYTDNELLDAFNTALLDGRRLRADLFVHKYGNDVPYYEDLSGAEVPIEPQFRLAFVYGTAAQAMARDDEDVQDERANSFRAVFESMLLGVRQPGLAGGATPGKGSQ